MVDSGIHVHPSCNNDFNELESKKLEYIIMKIEKVDGFEKVVIKERAVKGQSNEEMMNSNENTKGATPVWHRFCQKLREYPIAYGCCYVDYKSKDDRLVTKLVFVFWSDDEKVGITDKMKYSSTQVNTRKKLKSINKNLECHDSDDILFSEIVQKVSGSDCK